jgi:hypothetical protein
MVKDLLLKDKKGVSLMIGYVLLIVIAISVSVGVFLYLKAYVPLDKAECPDSASLQIDSITCELDTVVIELTNNGLFTLDGYDLRIGEPNRIFKVLINNDTTGRLFIEESNDGDPKLKPGKSFKSVPYEYPDHAGETREIEIEPFIYFDNRPFLCENAVVKRNVVCT